MLTRKSEPTDYLCIVSLVHVTAARREFPPRRPSRSPERWHARPAFCHKKIRTTRRYRSSTQNHGINTSTCSVCVCFMAASSQRGVGGLPSWSVCVTCCLLLLLNIAVSSSEAYRFRSSVQRAKPPYEGVYSEELVRVVLLHFFVVAKNVGTTTLDPSNHYDMHTHTHTHTHTGATCTRAYAHVSNTNRSGGSHALHNAI